MKSTFLRKDPKMVRNDYFSENLWGIPKIKKDEIDLKKIIFLGFDNVKIEPKKENYDKTIHFFLDDIKFERVFIDPERYLKRLAYYRYLLAPDYSVLIDMPLVVQLYNVFRNRWCGAYWQDYGYKVIPSISWGNEKSFDFTFLGIEKGSTVAISMIGTKKEKINFLKGYEKMIEIIQPQSIICYCDKEPYKEMCGFPNIFVVDYNTTNKRGK